MRDINLAILVHGLRLFDDLEKRARDSSGPPKLRAAVIGRISIGGTRLNPVTFLATSVADVSRRWRLVRDCCLLGEERAVVDTFAIMLSVCWQRLEGRRINLRSNVGRVSSPGCLVLIEHSLQFLFLGHRFAVHSNTCGRRSLAGFCASCLDTMLVLGVDRHLAGDIACSSTCTWFGRGQPTGDDGCRPWDLNGVIVVACDVSALLH